MCRISDNREWTNESLYLGEMWNITLKDEENLTVKSGNLNGDIFIFVSLTGAVAF